MHFSERGVELIQSLMEDSFCSVETLFEFAALIKPPRLIEDLCSVPQGITANNIRLHSNLTNTFGKN